MPFVSVSSTNVVRQPMPCNKHLLVVIHPHVGLVDRIEPLDILPLVPIVYYGAGSLTRGKRRYKRDKQITFIPTGYFHTICCVRPRVLRLIYTVQCILRRYMSCAVSLLSKIK